MRFHIGIFVSTFHINIAYSRSPTIEEGIEKLKQEDLLEGYFCGVCQEYGTAKMYITMKKIPDTLIVCNPPDNRHHKMNKCTLDVCMSNML